MFLVEFVVIVGSILAAFALDAWWSARIEDRETRARLETLRVEFEATRAEVARQGDRLEAVRQAVADVLPHVSPTAPIVTVDSITRLLDLSFRMTTIELQTGSLQALLASGQLADIESQELTALLAGWPADVARLRRQSQLLEDNRERIIEYLHDRIPTLAITRHTGQMGRYPGTSFTVSATAVQRDMKVEGLFGNRGMMIEDTDDIVRELDARAERVLMLIDEVLAR
jgi:hypothetical protein